MHPLYPFGCDQCHRMFTAEPALAEHRATHVDPAPVKASAHVDPAPVEASAHFEASAQVETSAHFEDQLARGMERNRRRRKQ